MPDPHAATPDGAMLGVKLASLVAGFAGGVVSLSFVRELTKLQAALAVLTGALCAGYLTPAVVAYLGSAFPEPSLAFVVGLTAMNIIPGVLKISELFKRNPMSFVNRGPNGGGDQQ